MESVNIPAKFEVRIALPVPEILGVLTKFGQSLDTPTLPFLPNFLWAFVRMDPMNISAEFTVRSFTRFWDNSDCILGWGCEPSILGKGRPYGVGDSTVRKSVGEFLYRPSTVTFHLSLRVSDILLLLCCSTYATFPHPTSSLPKISPCSPISRWMAFGLQRAKMFGKLSVQLVSKISNLCDPDPPMLQTDRQTDGRTDDMQSQYRALHYSPSRGKNYWKLKVGGKTLKTW